MQALSIDFWRELNRSLSIEAAQIDPIALSESLDPKELDRLLIEEGYFQLLPLRGQDFSVLADAITAIEAAKFPPVFAFVYDEFWHLFTAIHPLFSNLLGPHFKRLPDFWAWRVDGRSGGTGWRAHRDKGYIALLPDRRPKSLTVWIPLTDATPLNGCIYVVPAHRDPTYGTIDDKSLQFELGDIRALPAAAGSLLCWTQALMHWGATASSRASHPRISVAFEYQRADMPPFNEPLLPPDQLPNFNSRLRLVTKQLLQYKHMYGLSARDDELTKALAGTLLS